jgi:hypothetical protein
MNTNIPASNLKYITKSKILNFNRCENQFRLNLVKSYESNKQKTYQLYNLENDRVNQLAYSLYNNVSFLPKLHDVQEAFLESMRLIKAGQSIAHPVMISNDLIASPDLLIVHDNGNLEIIEILTSVNAKKEVEFILSFYSQVFEELNMNISNYTLIKINSDYTLTDTFSSDLFFKKSNYNNKIKASKDLVARTIANIRNIREKSTLENMDEPHICSSIKNCNFINECYPNLKDGDLLTLRESSNLVNLFYDKKIYNIADIPIESYSTILSEKQKIQILSNREKKPFINQERIQLFLKQIRFPVYYLDFETINPQIPFYNYTKPFQHVPFLYSLHIWRDPHSDQLEHLDYIQPDNKDPRQEILSRLSNQIKADGTILCFNDFFEKRCIQESVNFLPEYAFWSSSIKPNFLDSAIPFKSLDYYSYLQNGSASLKDILPALTGASHSHLDIQNGHSANLQYLRWLHGFDENETVDRKVIEQLREYCKMDTLALFLIHKKLIEITR